MEIDTSTHAIYLFSTMTSRNEIKHVQLVRNITQYLKKRY